MSARNNNKNLKASQEPKKFCKVCQDAGKTEKEYTSHWVRSSPGPQGKVVCPTLLAQECKYCFEKGHTTKYCAVLKKNQKNERAATYIAAKPDVKVAKTSVKKRMNKFDCLMDDSSEDEPITVSKCETTNTKADLDTKVEEFPALPSAKKITAVAAPGGIAYAAMAAKTQDDYLNEQFMMNLAKKRMMPAVTAKPVAQPVVYKNWADYSDDESDSEAEMPMQKASEIDWAQDDYDSDW